VRLVYYGTPAIAVPPLERLLADGRAPLLVVTRPDRPRGRGQRSAASPVRAAAESRGIPVVTPVRAGAPEELERLRALEPDLILLVAYGQILSPALLEIPRIGALNVHFSILPRHRGASPVQAAILAGDAETGVTTMWMTEGLDEGPVYLSEATPIGSQENAGDLAGRLALMGAGALARTLDRIEQGEIVKTPQDEAGATYAPKIIAAMSLLSVEENAAAFARRVRALEPEPGAYLDLGRERLQILAAEPDDDSGADGPAAGGTVPGTVLALDSARGLKIRLARGSVWLRRVRPSGRREMSGRDYANGARLKPGARLRLREGQG
jgi:methionyl-tRNA formyltransferase